ncbi:MAG: hypothetical protein DI629_12710 [Mesorhizobium amorphae]|nr:MAG: hypothetical protein DI629_12710 [Mesorhizobium amorphae]
MPVFSPLTRRLARRRHRLTSRRGGLVLALLVALVIGGGFLYWRSEVREALDANAPGDAMTEECADLVEAGELEGGTEATAADEAEMAAMLQRCEGVDGEGEE